MGDSYASIFSGPFTPWLWRWASGAMSFCEIAQRRRALPYLVSCEKRNQRLGILFDACTFFCVRWSDMLGSSLRPNVVPKRSSILICYSNCCGPYLNALLEKYKHWLRPELPMDCGSLTCLFFCDYNWSFIHLQINWSFIYPIITKSI